MPTITVDQIINAGPCCRYRISKYEADRQLITRCLGGESITVQDVCKLTTIPPSDMLWLLVAAHKLDRAVWLLTLDRLGREFKEITNFCQANWVDEPTYTMGIRLAEILTGADTTRMAAERALDTSFYLVEMPRYVSTIHKSILYIVDCLCAAQREIET